MTLITMLCLLYMVPQVLKLYAEAHRLRALMDGWMDGGMDDEWMDERHCITCRLATEVEIEASGPIVVSLFGHLSFFLRLSIHFHANSLLVESLFF